MHFAMALKYSACVISPSQERLYDSPTALGFVAVTLATINVVGGYLVTDRMLEMFRRKDKK